jgi:hypothetical protein
MRRWGLLLFAALAAACGGGTASPSSAPAPTPTPASRTATALDAATFDARVGTGASLVEFHSPT